MKKLTRLTALLMLLGFSGGFLVACETNDGPAEEAGESIDKAVEEAGDAIEEATDY